MFETALEQLSTASLIRDGDAVVACMDSTATAAAWGGAIAGAIAAASAKRYILAANDLEIKLFTLDSSYFYQGEYRVFPKADVKKFAVGSFLGSWSIFIKTNSQKIKFETRSKFAKRPQKEQLKALKLLSKTYKK